MIRVIIADDHGIIREGLKHVVATTTDLVVVGEARNGTELLDLVQKMSVDVVVLDLSNLDRNGLELLSALRGMNPGLPVLILSMHAADQYAVRVMRAGASGYLNKEAASTDLIRAVRTVAEGRKFVTESVAEQLAMFVSSPQSMSRHELLSEREYQVLCMIASGKTVTEIAEELNLSVKTISTYRTRIIEKMQLKTNAELTHYVVSNHLDS